MPDLLIDLAGLTVGAQDFLSAVLQRTAQPVWVVDGDGLIRFANPAAIAALGYDSAEELIGRRSHETIHCRRPDGSRFLAADCPMLLPLVTGETVARDLDWFVRRDGSMLPVSYVSAPLEILEGRGAVVAFTDIEDRVRGEESRREHETVLEAQQASLRRVGTLVTGGAAPGAVFAAIAREVAQLLGCPHVQLWRYETDAAATVIGAWSVSAAPFPAGTRWPLEAGTIPALVRRTGRAARIDDCAGVEGAIADALRQAGIRSGAGAPIVVDGRAWGVMLAWSMQPPAVPATPEARLVEVAELLATAIANTAGREELARLAAQEAALRRVATLVARGVQRADVFAAVAREVGLLLAVDVTHMARFEPDGTATGVAAWSPAGDHVPVGERVDLQGDSVTGRVLRTGRPARMHRYDEAPGAAAALGRELGIRSTVGAPIVVDEDLWGVMIVSSNDDQPLPADTEARIAAFTELVATAISSTEARTELSRLAEEQAALRRVATLVARESSPGEVFTAVAKEVGGLLGIENMRMLRYEADATAATVVAESGELHAFPLGARLPLGGNNITSLVARTGRPARIDDYGANASGRGFAAYKDELGPRSVVGSPIVVEGRAWGVMVGTSPHGETLPADTEARIGEFTELVATAIANVDARSELAASRARIVAATDQERRRVVRDLHDGAQQRLVHTIVTLKLARRAFQKGDGTAFALMSNALAQAEGANAELRELAHGILPSVLTRGGLRAGVESLAARMPVPVEIAVTVGRLPAAVEATAYFVVAEALTNVVKHSHAARAAVIARVQGGALHVDVRDDGIGGARPDGSGLLGLGDRLAVLDGRLRLQSPADGGTLVAAAIPLPDEVAESAAPGGLSPPAGGRVVPGRGG